MSKKAASIGSFADIHLRSEVCKDHFARANPTDCATALVPRLADALSPAIRVFEIAA